MVDVEIVQSRTKNKFLSYVYGWMALGLALTAIISYLVANNTKLVLAIQGNAGLLFTLFIIEIGLVAALSFFLNKMSSATAVVLFILYSVLNGFTLSAIFLIYEYYSIAITFLVTSLMFAALAIYGFVTKKELSGMGNFLFMGIIGLIIALLINMFLKSQSLNYFISAIGVIIFSLLTAYDVQQIKIIGNRLMMQGESLTKISIISALKLYLDFINLFLFLLEFLGQKRKD